MTETPWDGIWRDCRGDRRHWHEPDERVIRLAKTLKRESRKRVYDVGCGVGRHTAFLAREGFDVYASDISLEALNRCAERLSHEGLTALLTRNDMEGIPYAEELFDAVIAYHTIYHARWEKLGRTVEALRKTLSRGGYFLATLRATRDSGFGEGVELERNTFMRTGGEENLVIHHFCDERAVEELMREFSEVHKDLVEREWEGDGEVHRSAHWVVLARK